jgi:thioredoxin 1
MAELAITQANYESEVVKSPIPVLIDFWAPWCGPCRMLAPVIDELAKEFAGKIKVAKLNTDENIEISTQFQISSIPTILIFKNGKPVEKVVGFKQKGELVALINKVLG